MKPSRLVYVFTAAFLLFCGVLVWQSGVFESGYCGRGCVVLASDSERDDIQQVDEEPQAVLLSANKEIMFGAEDSEPELLTIGAGDPAFEDPTLEGNFKFQLVLDNKGAAIRSVVFSDGQGNGFDDRNQKDPKPLQILSAVNYNGKDYMTLANRDFILAEHGQRLRLNDLYWKSLGVEKDEYGCQMAKFEAIITDSLGNDIFKLTKVFEVLPDSYMVHSFLDIENLTILPRQFSFSMAGGVGIGREGSRSDMRKVVGGFITPEGKIASTRLDLRKFETKESFDSQEITGNGNIFLWAATVNKYFAAIAVPKPLEGKANVDWLSEKKGVYLNPDAEKSTEDEEIGVVFRSRVLNIAAGAKQQYKTELYVGPKDKKVFDKDNYYRDLGFVHTIDFMGCCCPAAVIRPLAFMILAIMQGLFGFIGNYGIVIIILVFIIRIVIHPLSKKSQVTMQQMGKLGPQLQELKSKYGGKGPEYQKHMMELYSQQGVSPMSPLFGILPMFIQMPIWIALYSAIYASIELRGASFLPFWITDLSAPDALISFQPFTLPLFGKIDSFNLLPILMGVAFYLQQKLMPKNPSVSTNPQMEQQQKMMMVMMPIMFPLMLYKAPSGLNLYIMASTFAGVVEQYFIRKHIKAEQGRDQIGKVPVTKKTGGKAKKKKPKPFFKTGM